MFSQTITTRFQEVKRCAERKGVCITCGKKRARKFSDSNTINPWNKNEDGTVKTYSDVEKNVAKLLNEFLIKFDKRGFKCSKCEDELWKQA